ncbi:MAG: hypothetical protein ACYSXF_07630, partial [Planctomycetota bacterium]
MDAQDFSWIGEISTIEFEFEKVGTLRRTLSFEHRMKSADGQSTEQHVVEIQEGERVFGSETACLCDGPPLVHIETADGRTAWL